jgi:hypothetical protein
MKFNGNYQSGKNAKDVVLLPLVPVVDVLSGTTAADVV